MDFARVEGETLLPSEPPEELLSLRIRLLRRDGSEANATTTIETSQLQSNAASTYTTVLTGVPLDTDLLLSIEGLDGQGSTVSDFEGRLFLHQSGTDYRAILTPLEEVRSGAFSILPLIQLDPEKEELLLRAEEEALAGAGFLLQNHVLFYPPSPADNWRLEIAGQTFRVGQLGRARIPSAALNGATRGILRHPSDDRVFSEVDLSTLSKGQIAKTPTFLLLPFAGPCGMDDRTAFDPNEFCSAVLAQTAPVSAQTAPAGSNIFPPSTWTRNRCNQIVPFPPESVFLDRGVYPQPKDFYRNGNIVLSPSSNKCEQANGRVGPGDIVLESSSLGEVDYFGSTCHKFVSVGACPNENLMADIFNLVDASLNAPVLLALKLGSWMFQTPEPVMLTLTLIPDGSLSCVDNHHGRLCQEVLIGDVSLDFSFSGKGGIAFPDTTPEIVIPVSLNETVQFVLHNNGSFGSTFVSRTENQLGGRLFRSYQELLISPRGAQQGLQVTTAPIFNGTPTSGDFQGPFVPGQPQVLSPPVGFLARPVEVLHYSTNPLVNPPTGAAIGWKYRYFPDLSLTYTAPGSMRSGTDDRYVFTVDGCSVAVTFRLNPDNNALSLIQTPSDELSQSHTVGTSPCPQRVGEIPVSNLSEQIVKVNASTDSTALSISPESLVLEPGTASQNFLVEFNCGTQASFSSMITLTASTPDGESQTITIPVSVAISSP